MINRNRGLSGKVAMLLKGEMALLIFLLAATFAFRQVESQGDPIIIQTQRLMIEIVNSTMPDVTMTERCFLIGVTDPSCCRFVPPIMNPLMILSESDAQILRGLVCVFPGEVFESQCRMIPFSPTWRLEIGTPPNVQVINEADFPYTESLQECGAEIETIVCQNPSGSDQDKRTIGVVGKSVQPMGDDLTCLDSIPFSASVECTPIPLGINGNEVQWKLNGEFVMMNGQLLTGDRVNVDVSNSDLVNGMARIECLIMTGCNGTIDMEVATIVMLNPPSNIEPATTITDTSPGDTIDIGQNTCEFEGQMEKTRIRCESLPGFTTQWFKDGELLSGESSSILTTTGPGMYTCSRTNECGSFNATSIILTRVEIIKGTGFIDDPQGGMITIGQSACFDDPNLRIVCMTSPAGEDVTWSFNGMVLSGVTGNSVRVGDHGTGTYQCSISTECGNDTATSEVTQRDSIRISGSIPGLMTTAGGCERFTNVLDGADFDFCLIAIEEGITISCLDAIGGYYIEKDGRRLSTNEPFTINSFSQSDIGVYECVSNDTTCGASRPNISIVAIPLPPIIERPRPPPSEPKPPTSTPLTCNIGEDMCILQNMPPMITILCGHDDDNRVYPQPMASWAIPNTVGSAASFSDTPLRWGTNDLLMLDNDGNPVTAGNLVGDYVCNLTNVAGFDVETTTIYLSPTIDTGDNSFDVGTEVNINDNGCETIGSSNTRITCPLTEGGAGISTTWFYNGMRLSETSDTLTNVGPGMYTCVRSNICANVSASTTIVGAPPPIPTPPALPFDPIDGPSGEFNYTVGHFICLNSLVPGETVNIVCPYPMQLIGFEQFVNFQWTKTNDPTFSSTSSFLSLDQSDSNILGEYTCTISTGLNGICGQTNASTTIILRRRLITGTGFDGSSNTIDIDTDTCVPMAGESVSLRCRLNPASSDPVMWYHNGALIQGETGDSLTITNTNQGAGVYMCIAMDGCDGNVSASSTVYLRPPPVPTPTNPMDGVGVTYVVGDTICLDPTITTGNVAINCPIPANYEPSLVRTQWTKNDETSIMSSDRILVLSRSDPDIAGNYTCTISTGPNGGCGQTRITSTVSVRRTLITDSGFTLTAPSTLVIGADTCLPGNITIQCQTQPSSNAPVTWSRNGMVISGEESSLLAVTTAGNYTCSVSDGCDGTLTATSTVHPQNQVSITGNIGGAFSGRSGCSRFPLLRDIDICLIPTEMLTIDCTSTTGQYLIAKEESGSFNTLSTDSSYVISSASVSDSGTYACDTRGGICRTERDLLTVFVGTPPRVTPMGGNVCLNESNPQATLDCSASGTPPFNYSWTRDGSQFSTEQMLTVSQAGVYQCTASNAIGSDTVTYTVARSAPANFQVSTGSQFSENKCSRLDVAPSFTTHCYFIGDTIQLTCTGVYDANGIIQPNGESGVKLIQNAQVSDNRTYTCNVADSCTMEASLALSIEDPARIDRTSPLPPARPNERNIGAGRPTGPVPVEPNSVVRLFCPFSGIDQPTTRWVRVNQDGTTSEIVEMPPDIVFERTNNQIVLVINNFMASQQGTYECDTDNNSGDDSGRVTLQIEDEEPPEWVPLQWAKCTRNCGGGYRTRAVICRNSRTLETVASSRCEAFPNLPRPIAFEQCNTEPCCISDLYPAYCKAVCGTSTCNIPQVRRVCCWSCRRW